MADRRECRGAGTTCQRECYILGKPWPRAISWGYYRVLSNPVRVATRAAIAASAAKSTTRGRLYVYAAVLEGLAEHLKDMAAALRQFIQEGHPVVRQRHFARRQHLAAADQPHIRDGMMWGATGPATRRRRVGSIASASVISGRIVVRRRASIDFPAPGGPSRRTLGSECLHHVQLHTGHWGAGVSAVDQLSMSEQR
jgi:hypothetical protein